MSRQAHMELAIQNNMHVNLGDVILYVNNGTRASHGDVVKKGDTVTINCYMLDPAELESNPNMTGEYNVPRAVSTFNKRIEPFLVVFKQEVRDALIVDDPKDRGLFTTEQCELINGLPLDEGGQDDLYKDVLDITPEELDYWNRRGLSPEYIYERAEEGWSQYMS
jgi:hypothetical protein